MFNLAYTVAIILDCHLYSIKTVECWNISRAISQKVLQALMSKYVDYHFVVASKYSRLVYHYFLIPLRPGGSCNSYDELLWLRFGC